MGGLPNSQIRARTLLVGAASAATLLCLGPQRAAACATCATGDPTLTSMGAQQPFEHRLRASLELQHRTDAVGSADVDRVELSEQRLAVSLAYAPTRWLMFSASLPALRRELQDVSLHRRTLWDAGDAEIRARVFFYQDQEFAPSHLLAGLGGIKLPTGALQRDDQGVYEEPELQAGSGSFDPLVGLSYAFFGEPWSFYASEVLYVPTQSSADWRMGVTLRGTHTLQYQFSPAFAARLGANIRVEEPTRRTDSDGNRFNEPDSGGFVLFAMPSLLVSPAMDLILSLDVHLPVVNGLLGQHDEGPVFALGAAYDF